MAKLCISVLHVVLTKNVHIYRVGQKNWTIFERL